MPLQLEVARLYALPGYLPPDYPACPAPVVAEDRGFVRSPDQSAIHAHRPSALIGASFGESLILERRAQDALVSQRPVEHSPFPPVPRPGFAERRGLRKYTHYYSSPHIERLIRHPTKPPTHVEQMMQMPTTDGAEQKRTAQVNNNAPSTDSPLQKTVACQILTRVLQSRKGKKWGNRRHGYSLQLLSAP